MKTKRGFFKQLLSRQWKTWNFCKKTILFYKEFNSILWTDGGWGGEGGAVGVILWLYILPYHKAIKKKE